MPRKPRKKRSTIALTWQQILCLIERRNRIPGQHFRDESHRKDAWQNNKKAIMKLQSQPLFIGEDTAALQRSLKRDIWFAWFQRPLAWFQYDMHEVLRGPYNTQTLFFIESMCCGVPYDAEISEAPKNVAIYRNQKEYLIKKNLLNPAEKAL